MNRIILLVEDNASDEKLALLAFQKCGVPNRILVVRDGAAALEFLFDPQREVLPAVVLLDLKLPKVDGLEVLRRIRSEERTKLLPVVVFTASREDQDVQRCYALGANAYVRKPVEFAEFLELTKALALFWLSLNESAHASIGTRT